MSRQTKQVFTESALGGLPEALRWTGHTDTSWNDRPAQEASEPISFVETLGLPKGTPPLKLAQVLEDIRGTATGRRVQRLLSPGVLSPLFSRSAAEASYALSVLSIVESPNFDTILARLRCS